MLEVCEKHPVHCLSPSLFGVCTHLSVGVGFIKQCLYTSANIAYLDCSLKFEASEAPILQLI